jgi:ribosome-binding factor A
MAGVRLDKFSALIKKEVSLIFQKEARALFGGAMISVTQTRVSPDLGHAKVYVSVFPTEKRQEAFEAVKNNSFAIKKLLTAAVGKQMRKVPELAFYLDDSLDYFEEIDRLLKKG